MNTKSEDFEQRDSKGTASNCTFFYLENSVSDSQCKEPAIQSLPH